MYMNQPYNPYGFSSGYQPGFQPPMGQQMPVPKTPEITVAQVPSIDQVEQVQMLPGDRKIILVQNAPVIAIRIADQMGLVQTEYRKTEVFSPQLPTAVPVAQSPATQIEYAPLSVVQELQSQLQAVTRELSTLKGANQHGRPVKQPVSDTAAETGSKYPLTATK